MLSWTGLMIPTNGLKDLLEAEKLGDKNWMLKRPKALSLD